MRKASNIHFDMLSAQVESIFVYYASKVDNKWALGDFEPLVSEEGNKVVSYSVEFPDANKPNKRQLLINVVVEDRNFNFYQNYTFGVPMHSGVQFRPISTDKDLMDLEYALSIATEHTAQQLSKIVAE